MIIFGLIGTYTEHKDFALWAEENGIPLANHMGDTFHVVSGQYNNNFQVPTTAAWIISSYCCSKADYALLQIKFSDLIARYNQMVEPSSPSYGPV